VTLGQTIPAMPVRDTAAAVACYRDGFGFSVAHQVDGFAVMVRDDAEVHLWEAGDTSWETRPSMDSPVRSGAESFIAGTASFRVAVDDVDALYRELQRAGVLHYADKGAPVDTDFGTREFPTVDVDGNLITFFRWVTPPRN
jgi:catechol 2,3-dioxygenase-like lactoylglutathione lyase family enzyme